MVMLCNTPSNRCVNADLRNTFQGYRQKTFQQPCLVKTPFYVLAVRNYKSNISIATVYNRDNKPTHSNIRNERSQHKIFKCL